MKKLDRLGWAAGITFVSYGLRIGIRVNAEEALPELLSALPPGWRPAEGGVVDRLYSLRIGEAPTRPGVRSYHLAYAGPIRIARTLDRQEALARLESDLQLYVAERARRRLFVHAAVVGWQGRAVVLPGASFSGKSTLAAALVRAGAVYYSDEYAVFDRYGRVHPYPRPLLLRDGSPAGHHRATAEHLGGVTGAEPLPVGLIALCQHREDGRWRPRRLTGAQAVLGLLANTVPARRQPAKVLPLLRQVAQAAPVLKTARGEAEDVVPLLLNAIARRS